MQMLNIFQGKESSAKHCIGDTLNKSYFMLHFHIMLLYCEQAVTYMPYDAVLP